MELNGADIVVRCLAEQGVKHVFGYPGGAVLYIYDAIYQQDYFKHILVRHEQAAVHAADAYSRSSNQVGVALVTSGPGLTNAVTGIATAYMDSIPMVVISGQVPITAVGQDAFQECDAVGITRPCVKHNFLVRDVRDLADTLRRAFHIASTGRPGPVLVDIPKDITVARCKYTNMRGEVKAMRSYTPVVKGHQGQIRRAVQMLQAAERPMIYAGGGAVLLPENRHLLHTRGIVVYLRVALKELYRRLEHDRARPLLQGADPQERIRSLLQAREPLYADVAHLTLDTGPMPVNKVVRTLLAELHHKQLL